ncbi:translation initiation factor IF-2-like isoform X1 [Tyto alba]|uniref:translation initiation factor IF-2-like isoform X1 n=1 Tax=Tyto alba TaxID=56313 RepID=UPI001C67B72C|nr:translation initiation factor IF-2-like isoform X1 [Tyto alba]
MGAPDTGHRGLPAHTHGCARQTRAPRGAGGAGEPRGSTPRVKRRRGVTAKSRKGGAGVSPSARPDGGGHGCPWPARCGWGGPGSGAGGAPVTAALQEVAPARGPQPHPGAGSLAGGSRGGTRSRGGTAAPRCLASTGSARPAVPRSPPWRGASRSLAPRGLRGRGARSGTFPASGCTGDPRRGLGFSHLYSRGAGSARYTTRKIFLFFLEEVPALRRVLGSRWATRGVALGSTKPGPTSPPGLLGAQHRLFAGDPPSLPLPHSRPPAASGCIQCGSGAGRGVLPPRCTGGTLGAEPPARGLPAFVMLLPRGRCSPTQTPAWRQPCG